MDASSLHARAAAWIAPMRPGMVLVIDPRPEQAVRRAADMLALLGTVRPEQRVAARGRDWAAVAIAPPAQVNGCGADVYARGDDLLIWAGDPILPGTWSDPDSDHNAIRATARRLLARLQREGLNCLEEVDGSFCGAWFDGARRRWCVFNDRLGLLPVFWSQVEDGIIVGPHAASVWRVGGRPLRPDADGIVDCVRAMNVTCDRTLIEGVHWLQGGHVLEWSTATQARRTRQHCYWQYQPQEVYAGDTRKAMDAYVDAFAESIGRHTQDAGRLVMGLSGGIDSRMILALCHELHRRPHCFSAGFPFSPDVRFGKRLASAAGVGHSFVGFSAQGAIDRLRRLILASDGLHGALHLVNSLPILDYLSTWRGAVLLEGHIHGIAGGGAVPEDDDVTEARPPSQSRWARKHCHAGGDVTVINRLLHPDLAERTYARWCAQINDRYARCPSKDALIRAEYAVFNGRSGRNDVLGPALWREDVLLRSPATDRRMLQWCAAIPGRWRRGKALYMEILRTRFPRFARVQRTDFSGLPISRHQVLREICWQREKLYHRWARLRYRDYREWGRRGHFMTHWLWNQWRDQGLDVLREKDARVLEWIDRKTLGDLWSGAVHNLSCARPLLTLGTVETMLRALEEPVEIGPETRPSADAFLQISRPSDTHHGAVAQLAQV